MAYIRTCRPSASGRTVPPSTSHLALGEVALERLVGDQPARHRFLGGLARPIALQWRAGDMLAERLLLEADGLIIWSGCGFSHQRALKSAAKLSALNGMSCASSGGRGRRLTFCDAPSPRLPDGSAPRPQSFSAWRAARRHVARASVCNQDYAGRRDSDCEAARETPA